MAGSYDGTDIKIYVDGELEGSVTLGKVVAYTGSAPLVIGNILNSNHGERGVFNGLIDEVRIFNRALSAAEIKAIFDAGGAGKIKPEPVSLPIPATPGLVAWWPRDGGATEIGGGNAWNKAVRERQLK